MTTAQKLLDREERRAWLRLIRTDNIGPVTFRQIVKRYGSATKAIAKFPEIVASSNRKKPLRLASPAQIDQELAYAEEIGAYFVASCEPSYPVALRAIFDAPPLLCVLGRLDLTTHPMIGIVGARNASAAGLKMAAHIARDLGAEGYYIISGLARGIDGAAHQAALTCGTVAVVAGGVDVIYPPEHKDLTHKISTLGAVISEQPLTYTPKARDFPKRNRIISGLSQAVIVVEAATKSGTLITARCALEQGREVFAVPGSPLDPRAGGTNSLIQQGAMLVTKAQDVVDALSLRFNTVKEPEIPYEDAELLPPEPFDSDQMQAARGKVSGLFSSTGLHPDHIVQLTGLPPAIVMEVLLDMVLVGRLNEASGGEFFLCDPEWS